MTLVRCYLVLLLLLTSCAASPAGVHFARVPLEPGPTERYIRDLTGHARQRGLATSVTWLRLGHWKKTDKTRWESQADGMDFFLSPYGKTSPQAELDATIRGFFSTEEFGGKQHPICRFPARFLYLTRELGWDLTRIDLPSCPRFEEFLTTLAPKSITLVFSSYFLNNPSSAFGHVFLRINKREHAGTRERQELLDFGIDFAAQVDTGNALVYVFKGMTGLFRGVYGKVPYYFKVREYNDYESRDLWEYELGLSDQQLSMVVAHLWELGSTYFDYFYMTENCAYHILGALEVGDPGLNLLGQLSTPVIPSDTIKAVFRNPGLVKKVSFRPSVRTQFRSRVGELSEDELDLVEKLSLDPESDLPREIPAATAIKVYDTAVDLVDIQYAKELIHEDDATGTGRRFKHRLMERRAAIQQPSETLKLEPPWPRMPQMGHDSRRIGLGLGRSSEGDFVSLQFRFSLHDLADPTSGYPELSQIEFFPAKLRFNVEAQTLRLDSLLLAHIINLTSQDRFDRSVSWEVSAGATTIDDAGCPASCLAGKVEVGGGFAKALFDERLTLFAMAEVDVLSSPSLEGLAGSPVRAGVGPSGGLRVRLSERLVALFRGEWIWLPWQLPGRSWSTEGVVRWGVLESLALDLHARVRREGREGTLSLLLYY